MIKAKKIKGPKITVEIARRVLDVVDAGLSNGMGNPHPGQMCVEAAVAYAMGEKHHDRPRCVTNAIASTKIGINDSSVWPDDITRARGLRRIAIAQLGSFGVITDKQWETAVNAYIFKHMPAKRRKSFLKDRAGYEKELLAALTTLKSNVHTEVSIDFNPDDYINSADPFESLYCYGQKDLKKAMKVTEDLVQILIKLKSPGTKFLFLTEKPKVKKTVKKAVKKRK